MKSLIQVIISSLILCIATSSFADEAKIKENQRIKTQNMKFMMINPQKSLKLIEVGIDEIIQNCCEDNFNKKNEITEIKNNLEKCLVDKCHENTMAIYFKKEPPPKAIVMRQLGKIDDLILENEKLRLKNISSKLKKAEELTLKNSQNENDIKKLKLSLKQMSKDNNELRQKIDMMIAKYIKKIDSLKKDNDNLNDKFNTSYELLSPSKKKKLDKILSE